MWICAAVAGVLLSLTSQVTSQPASQPIPRPVPRPVRGVVPAACASGECRAAQVLHQWDRSRARAFVAADPAALARLYESGSLAGRHDLALLDRYVGAGVRITTMTTQVFSLRARAVGGDRIVVDLVDRVLAAGSDGHRCLRLPTSLPRAHRVTLIHRTTGWVTGSVG